MSGWAGVFKSDHWLSGFKEVSGRIVLLISCGAQWCKSGWICQGGVIEVSGWC